MGLIRAQEPVWLIIWLCGVLSFRFDRLVNKQPSEDLASIEKAMLASIRPYNLGTVDRRYVVMSRMYNGVSCLLMSLCLFRRR